MDGFKKLPKQIACFKEGGSIQRQVENFTKRDRKSVESADIAQDKKVVKKAFGMHDSQQHDGEKTDLSALKKGGRAKKATGTVKKYKTGGSVTNVYEAKKSAGDLDNIQKTKDIKPGKAAAPSKAATKGKDVGAKTVGASGHKDPYIKSKESGKSADAASGAKGGPNKYKKGGSIKKMADGGILDTLKNNIMGTPQQNAIARQNEAKYLRAKQLQRASGAPMGPAEQMATGLASAGQQLQPAPTPAPAAMPAPQGVPMPAQKKGGKVKKLNTGGTCS